MGTTIKIDTSYEITFPEIDSGEHQTLANATNLLVQALSNAKAQGWISSETAMRMIFEFAGEEVDVEEEMEKVAQERAAQLAAHVAMMQAQTGQPGQAPTTPGQKVPNQRSLDQQQAEASENKV